MLSTEQTAPRGSGSPLHVHHNEDEWFYVLEGELTIWVAGQTVIAPAGSFVFGPRDIPHTFIVSSDEARFLLVTQPAGFEGFIRTLGAPAPVAEIPPAPTGARHGAGAAGRRRSRPRDPRPSRHPGLTRPTTSCAGVEGSRQGGARMHAHPRPLRRRDLRRRGQHQRRQLRQPLHRQP